MRICIMCNIKERFQPHGKWHLPTRILLQFLLCSPAPCTTTALKQFATADPQDIQQRSSLPRLVLAIVHPEDLMSLMNGLIWFTLKQYSTVRLMQLADILTSPI